MTEIKVTIDALELADAIRTLAAAIQSRSTAAVETAAIVNTPVATVPATLVATPAIQPATVNPIQTAPAVTGTPATTATTSSAQTTPVTYPSNPPVTANPAPATAALTLESISNAGAGLLEKGMMPQLMALLGKYGVQAITQLTPDQYPAFASELRAMGAAI